MVDLQAVAQQVREAGRTSSNLPLGQFTLSKGTSGEESTVAEFKAGRDLVLRQNRPLRLTLIAYETFTTDGSGGNQETFNLSNDIVESPNTENFYLYDETNGTEVSEDSVDYSNNSFKYTDSGTSNTIAAYYVARDPGTVEIVKKAPSSQGKVEETIFDDATSLIHEQNQHQDPLYLSLGQSKLQPVVPEDWKLQVRADCPYVVKLDVADNGLLQVPAAYLDSQVSNLSKAVAQDIIDRS